MSGSGGSGALSHVYIQHPPLRCNIPETQGLFYDDGNKLLLSPTSGQVLSWKIDHQTWLDPPSSDSIEEGPVISIRYSLDRKVIGIQRSNHEIQFKNNETGETLTRRCRSDVESILGFFWTDCPSCDVIIIKTSGIDLLSYEAELNTLRLVEAKKLSVSWYIYTHESRLVLLASGMQCTIFSAFQFSSGGIVRLPKFEMPMSKTEANQRPVLAAEDVHIVTIYGRIYCLQLDKVGMVLNSYRFYRDAVVQQGTFPIYSSRIAVSVVDNVLLIHQVDAKVVILYDVFLDSIVPVSAPLPLLLKGTSTASRQNMQEQDNLPSAYGGTIYGNSWTFLVPNLICDVDNGMLWKISLDLEAISASSSDVPSLLEFLQRRRSDPSKIKLLCLTLMRAIILERRPIAMISKAIDVLVSSFSQSVRLANALHGGDKRVSERTNMADVQHTLTFGTTSDELSNSTVNPEKSVGQESLIKSHHLENETPDHASTSTTKAPEHERSLSGDSSGREDKGGQNISSHTSAGDIGRSVLEPEASEQNKFVTVSISPDEIYRFVFLVIEEEMGGDPSYLVSVIIEFFRSMTKEKLKAHPDAYVMAIQLLVRSNRYAELGLFVIHKIIEPSKEVALQLLDSGRQDIRTKKLGIEMLRQLSLHNLYINILLDDGYYLEALRYARKNKVITVRPSLFLEAALAANNSQHLATVIRFFCDFTPGFKSTLEHERFHRILTEM